MKEILAVVLGMLLSGCAATGVQVEEGQLTEFKKGETTLQEVIATLGAPTTSILNGDGTRMIMYTYASYTTRPETFIPIIGGLIGGADIKTNQVNFSFDQSGTLTEYSASQSQMGTGTGVAAKTRIDQERTNQPIPVKNDTDLGEENK